MLNEGQIFFLDEEMLEVLQKKKEREGVRCQVYYGWSMYHIVTTSVVHKTRFPGLEG